MDKIKTLKSRTEELAHLDRDLKACITTGTVLHILEAGCGTKWHFDLAGAEYTLTGVDIDETALNYRKTEINDLDETILGDLRYINLGKNKYDVIYNSFVLEHIEDAELVLNNFVAWLKPGGILILRFPDRDSVFGFTTRITPHWFHVLYKRMLGQKSAGKPGHGPYRTVYDDVVSRKGIHSYCKRNSLIIKNEYGYDSFSDMSGYIPLLAQLYTHIMGIASLGQLATTRNSLTYVIEKPESGSSMIS